MTKEERIFHTNSLLQRFPAYGEFEVIFDAQTQMIDGSDFLNPGNNIMPTINDIIKINQLKHEAFLKEQEIIQDLIFEGFIINRHDIKVEGKIYRQLTDKGRELKALGSMEEFNRYVENNNHKAWLQEQRLTRLYWINFWIAVGAIAAGLYYFLEILRIQYHIGLPYHLSFP